MLGPLPIYCLGDSHVEYFQRAARHHLFMPRRVDGCEVGGATAVGMRNPNALTNAVQHFRKWLNGRDPNAIVVVHLGEVDCGYVIWYRSAKHGESVDHQLHQSINAYFDFIDELISTGRPLIVVTGATLPTISDRDQLGDVIKKRSAITVSQRDRTDLTLRYNDILKIKTRERGLIYADITPDVLDPATNMVRDIFRNKNPEDHHMDYDLASVAWSNCLNSAFDRYDPRPSPEFEAMATVDSFLLGLALSAQQVPSSLKMRVCKGDRFRATYDGEAGNFMIFRGGEINGSQVETRIRLLRKAHWKIADPKVLAGKRSYLAPMRFFLDKPTFTVFA